MGRWTVWAVSAAGAAAAGAALAASRRRRPRHAGPEATSPPPPAPPPDAPPPEDPQAALDAARERLRRRADALRAEIDASGDDAPEA